MTGARKGARIRAHAAEAVDAVVTQGRSLDVAIARAESNVGPDDRALLRALCFGTVRFHWRLSAQVSQFINKPLKARDSVINALLLVGVYQITDTRVSDHAVVSMTAEAARLLRKPKLVPLVNAVLRNFLRLNVKTLQNDDAEIQYNHPSWFIEQVRVDWPDHWQAILEANNNRAPMWLRVNARHMSAQQYLLKLTEVRQSQPEQTGRFLKGLDEAICLNQPWAIEDLPGFREGLVSVQDGAAQIAAPWLLADGGARVLDACAAPGGKTGHLLELADDEVSLTAIDSDGVRVELINENLARLGLSATVVCADASKAGEWRDGELFDRILLDAPCSASGVIRRHPDIKLLRRETDIGALSALQLSILENLWPLLAPGGRLLYVTCSVLRKENDDVVAKFKDRHEDHSEAVLLPNNNIRDLMLQTSHGLQVLPGTHGLDGFFFACLEKN